MIGCNGSPLLLAFCAVALIELVGNASMLLVDDWSAEAVLDTDFGVSELDDATAEELWDPETVDANPELDPLTGVGEGLPLGFSPEDVIETSARLWTSAEVTVDAWSTAMP